MKHDNLHQQIELNITSQLENVSLVSTCVHALALMKKFSPAQASGIELSVNEAVTNCIRHAYQDNKFRPVRVRVFIGQDKMTLEVMDQGQKPPENLLKSIPLDFDDITMDIADIPESGRGLTLIINLMDSVETDSQENWNILRMTKCL